MRYVSAEEDSARWSALEPRAGDVVVSSRSKHGTTWLQTVCVMLLHGTTDLPAPLAELSPWLDWTVEPLDEVVARLEAQRHRRVVKTHTPLDGLPLDLATTYVVVARDPLDAAVSLHHQGANIDRERVAALTGRPATAWEGPPLRAWLLDWVERDADPREELDSLPGVLHHLTDAWTRRSAPNVVLVHYDDLVQDLPGEVRRLARRLGVDLPEERLAGVVDAARFGAMRARAAALAPGPPGVLRNPTAFFRRGRSGAGRKVLGAEQVAHYRARAATLAPPDLLAWLHRGAVGGQPAGAGQERVSGPGRAPPPARGAPAARSARTGRCRGTS